MAEDDNRFDDEFDQIPGNARHPPEYAGLYHEQGEDEWTNLPENPNQIELAREEQRIAEALRLSRDLEESASERIQVWPHVGRFVIPKDNTFQAHFVLVQGLDEENDLHFNPDRYQYFDLVVAGVAERPEIFDPSHPEYPKYENLRDNLAVLRNDVLGIYMSDASYDPGDEVYIPHIVAMAEDIGLALKNEKAPVSRIFKPYLNSDMMNILGDGAAYTYRFLLDQQEKPSPIFEIRRDLKQLLGMKTRSWYLPPIEQTPFTDEGLNAPPPEDVLSMSTEEMASYVGGQPDGAQALDPKVIEVLQQQQQAALQQNTMQVVSEEDKAAAVEHGIVILEWLRNLQLSEKSVEEVISTGTPQEQAELSGFGSNALQQYAMLMSFAIEQNPELRKEQSIQQAEKAAEMLDHSIRVQEARQNSNTLQQLAATQPPGWNEMKKESPNRLMRTLSKGLETAVRDIQQSMSQQMQQQQQQDQQRQSAEHALNQALFLSDTLRRKKKNGVANPFARKIDESGGHGGGHMGRNFLYDDHQKHDELRLRDQRSLHDHDREDGIAERYRDIDGDGIADREGEMTSGQRRQMNMHDMEQLAEENTARRQQLKQGKNDNPFARKIDDNWGHGGGHMGRDFLYDDHQKHDELKKQDQKTWHDRHDTEESQSNSNSKARDIDGDGIADRAGEMTSGQKRQLHNNAMHDAANMEQPKPGRNVRENIKFNEEAIAKMIEDKKRLLMQQQAQLAQQESFNGKRLIDGTKVRTGGAKGRNFDYDDHEHRAELRPEMQTLHSKRPEQTAGKGKAVDVDGDGIADTAGEMGSIAKKDLDMIRMLGQQIRDSNKVLNKPHQNEAQKPAASPVDSSFTARTQQTDADKNKQLF